MISRAVISSLKPYASPALARWIQSKSKVQTVIDRALERTSETTLRRYVQSLRVPFEFGRHSPVYAYFRGNRKTGGVTQADAVSLQRALERRFGSAVRVQLTPMDEYYYVNVHFGRLV
jgi:hypothetical protein